MSDNRWQPIETVPRDGTRVLAYFPDDPSPIQFAAWRNRVETEFGVETRRVDRLEMIGRVTFWLGREVEATHWMPLPGKP